MSKHVTVSNAVRTCLILHFPFLFLKVNILDM